MPALMSKLLVAMAVGAAKASFDAIAGYMPNSAVTDHNAIDLDQQAFENLLDATTPMWAEALAMYENGGNSRSQVTITFAGSYTSTDSLASSMIVRQDNSGVIASGSPNPSLTDAGQSSFRMRYTIGDIQATYVGCRTGQVTTAYNAVFSQYTAWSTTPPRWAPNTAGCFTLLNPICVNDGTGTVAACPGGWTIPSADLGTIAHSAGRTISGFVGSTGGYRSETGCLGCPYKDFVMFYNYFGLNDFSDAYVRAAIGTSANGYAGTSVVWGPSSPAATDFPIQLATWGADARVEVATKGTNYLTTMLYAIREFEDALDDCDSGSLGLNDEPVHAWDEGIAFYTGSIEGAYGTRGRIPPVAPSGVQYYNLADYRCQNFRTCTGSDGVSGTSMVNRNIFALASQGQSLLLMGRCNEVRPIVEQIVNQMRVPAIQGTMRYSYRIARLMSQIALNENWYAEGATFAAVVLPAVHSCSPAAATAIASNINMGVALRTAGDVAPRGSNTDWMAIKNAFESVYGCLNITCADVGGFWRPGTEVASATTPGGGVYYDDASPCTFDATPSESSVDIPTWGVIVIAILGGMFALFALCFLYIIQTERSNGKPFFFTLQAGTGTASA